jgi:hypothetical protein
MSGPLLNTSIINEIAIKSQWSSPGRLSKKTVTVILWLHSMVPTAEQEAPETWSVLERMSAAI